jgi:hypothetical protein
MKGSKDFLDEGEKTETQGQHGGTKGLKESLGFDIRHGGREPGGQSQ